MIHVGTLGQVRLPKLLYRLHMHKKTGKVLVIQDTVQEEIYVCLGEVVAVRSARPVAPLVRRLVHSGALSLNDLKKVPKPIGQILSQTHASKQYNDVQIAKILIKLDLISNEQLTAFMERETKETLQQVVGRSNGEVYFEEGTQPPPDQLCTLPITEASVPVAPAPVTLHNEEAAHEKRKVPDALPSAFFENAVYGFDSEPIISIQSSPIRSKRPPTSSVVVPVTPAAPVTLPGPISLTYFSRLQTLLPLFFPDDTPTASMAKLPKPHPVFRWETLLIMAILLMAGLAHGINMFHFPYFENDEGTYMSQAWSVVVEGRLAPYTYSYDHAPAGWLQIALWVVITGGFHTFGTIINSGRCFMLVLQLGSTLMLYYIARNASRSITIAALVALIFALSPYGLYYHRRVLLDNITTFWMLLSMLPLFTEKVSLKKVWLSAIALGISILSKEVTAFIVPAMLYLVFFRAYASHRWYAVIGWITIVVSIISLYVLYALLNNEFFPSSTLQHVSLISTLQYQAARGKDGGLFDIHSGFWHMLANWVYDDPLLVVGGTFCAVVSIAVIRWNRLMGIVGILTLSLWVFLGRGGETIDFYLVPLLPCLALNVGLLVGLLVELVKKRAASWKRRDVPVQALRLLATAACLVGMLSGYASPNAGFQQNHFLLWQGVQTDGQHQAIVWVEEHLPQHSVIVVDDASWTDLYDTGTDVSFKNVQWYWKVDLDPAVRVRVLHNDWRNIDYLVVTSQMLHDAQVSHLTLVQQALEHARVLARFDTGAWPTAIYKVIK